MRIDELTPKALRDRAEDGVEKLYFHCLITNPLNYESAHLELHEGRVDVHHQIQVSHRSGRAGSQGPLSREEHPS